MIEEYAGGDPTQFEDYLVCLCTLNEICDYAKRKVVPKFERYIEPFEDLANVLQHIPTSIVIAAEDVKRWGIANFDEARGIVSQPLYDMCIPLLSGQPLYNAMDKKRRRVAFKRSSRQQHRDG